MEPSQAGVAAAQLHPQRVHLLADSLVDQIAAGEVVERPASVAKELVENALDAGARRIRVEVRDGGASLIAVSDDGHGMPQGDARLALQRHATSKIGSPEDLHRITSFGFRGEALPAIASVSRFRLTTREASTTAGWEIRVEGGVIVDERTAGCSAGTRIEVADLFGAIPARRKFLKKPATEWGHIRDWLGRLALTLPGVHFELQQDDRPPLVWPATQDPLTRIAAVLTEEVASALVPASWEGEGGHLEAYLSGPEQARSHPSGLYLSVNGRPVRDAVLRHAVLDAYRDLLPRGRFPTAVVFLTVPPQSVDVNVHPAKWEVRFSDPRAIHDLVRSCVRKAMSGRRWLESEAGPAVRSHAPELPTAAMYPPSGWRMPPAANDPGSERPLVRQGELIADAGIAPEPDRLAFGTSRLLGQLLASYLVIEGKHGLVLVDQHAAHERVLYERLRAEWLGNGVSCQALLVPETVEIEALALSSLAAAAGRIRGLGFDLEGFGEGAVLVRGIPALLSGHNPAELVRGLAQELGDPDLAGADRDVSDTRLAQGIDRVFATLACHGARRFGDHLEPAEQRAILEGLDRIPWAPTCPHGRPVAVSVGVAEIERRFGRR
jgi:DNA mismatch repair protein MutL